MKKTIKTDKDLKEFLDNEKRIDAISDKDEANPNLEYKDGMFHQKKHLDKVKREFWKGTSYFVARDSKGIIRAKIKEKDSKLTYENAKELYKENGTFTRQIKRERVFLTNMYENSEYKRTSLNNRFKKPELTKPKGNNVQYYVSGELNGKTIVGRSHFIRKNSIFASNIREAKAEAWNTFLKRIAEESGLSYDEDEGITQIQRIRNLKEGYIWYSDRKEKL